MHISSRLQAQLNNLDRALAEAAQELKLLKQEEGMQSVVLNEEQVRIIRAALFHFYDLNDPSTAKAMAAMPAPLRLQR